MKEEPARRWPVSLGIIGVMLFVVSSCVDSPIEKTGISTKVTAQQGDTVTMISGMLEPITSDTKNQLVKSSDAIILGAVVDIRPSKWGADVSGHEVIYTDVIIQVQRYLFGGGSNRVAVRVIGGRVAAAVTWAEDQPVFYLGEDLVVFLFNQTQYYTIAPVPPDGITLDDYYAVTKSSRGKWPLEEGRFVDYSNNRVSISSIERLIEENGVK